MKRRVAPTTCLHTARHGHRDIFAGYLDSFQIGVNSLVAATLIQQVPQPQPTGSLAGLARSVEQKVFSLIDQPDNFIGVSTL